MRMIRIGRLILTALATVGMVALLPGSSAAQGPMINGENHMGTISAPGQFDTWTFSATAGDAILVGVGEVGDNPAFNPWIQLNQPDGTYVDSSFGPRTGHIQATAPVSGTYSVIVADSQDSATGSYLLTLAKSPGTFVVPFGDEGGPMINGAHHPGFIHRGDLDQWTFEATAGEYVSVGVAETGPDSLFAPWIRVFGPNGAFLGQGYSQLGGKVDLAPAQLSGTYTVVVATSDATYSETGWYTVTVDKKVAPFVVPVGDEGGPMANNVTYQGFIQRGRLNQWAFLATAGQPLKIDALELGGDGPFYPWLRLYAPGGSYVGESYGPVSAEISMTAPATGLYIVSIGSADDGYTASGAYSLRATGIDLPPAIDLGDIAADFGATNGLWMQTNQAGPNPQWQQLNSLSPTKMARGDIDGSGMVSLVATFQGYGVWIWSSTTGWTQLNPSDADDIVLADLDGNGQDDIILNFPGAGIWVRYNNTTWFQLHTLNSTALATGDIDGDADRKSDLIINFAGYGVWAYMNNASWVQLNPSDAFDIQTGDFDGNGQDDIVMNIQGQGIWIRLNNGGWSQLHALNSSAMTIGDIDGDGQHHKDIVITFPGYGVWAWMNNTAWTQLHSLDAPVLATVDLDKNGQDDVIMSFTGYGTWLWKNNASWELWHALNVKGLATGRFDIN